MFYSIFPKKRCSFFPPPRETRAILAQASSLKATEDPTLHTCSNPFEMAKAMRAMKAMRAAMRAMKAKKRVSKIAMGKMSKAVVFRGNKQKTSSG